MDLTLNSALPPVNLNVATLALKLFREKPPFQVRLEFLRYPQVIQDFQRALVRSSSEFHLTFNLLMGRSHGFVYDIILHALFRLGFPTAPSLQLNLPIIS